MDDKTPRPDPTSLTTDAVNREIEHLQVLLMARIDALQEETQQWIRSATTALEKAEDAMEKRFEGVEEIRRTLADQTLTLIPRSEATLRMDGLQAQIRDLSSRIERTEGSADGGKAAVSSARGKQLLLTASATAGIAVIAVIANVVIFILNQGA